MAKLNTTITSTKIATPRGTFAAVNGQIEVPTDEDALYLVTTFKDLFTLVEEKKEPAKSDDDKGSPSKKK